MINRDIINELKILITEYPVVTILGPRQAGKTTLAKKFLVGYEYSNLEDPSVRDFAKEDPKAYLNQFKSRVIIDEIQRVPELLSYIQVIVDSEKINGRFILTGSHQLQLQESIAQSLAGRTAILKLLPLSINELNQADINFNNFEDYCLKGFLPRVHDQSVRPTTLYSNYYQTYIERDVKLLVNIKDLSLFEKLIKLMAGRAGQLIDYNSLSSAVGVDAKTIKGWLSILEASFILFKLPPFYENFGKRVIKSPKYYFTDVGLLCFLLGIENKDQVRRDPLVGNIFENLVVIECLKEQYNKGKISNLYFFRDTNGNEVDIVFQDGRELVPIEIKSSSTFNTKFLKGINKFQSLTDRSGNGVLIYSGDLTPESEKYSVINFQDIPEIFKPKD
jgi:predicted AAA+ superfamily ATPase